jgi:hypothetical protein
VHLERSPAGASTHYKIHYNFGGRKKLPLSPHRPRQEIDPRLEIFIEIAIPGADPSQRAKGIRRERE